jgi:hypothetical protein
MMETGNFPLRPKSSALKPVHKKGYKCISNYRPISVLMVFSETFENIICR